MKNETHKILWDFEKQTDHLISARQPVLVIVNNNNNNNNNNKREPAELRTLLSRLTTG